jgi:uncharacterized protein (TIGR03435 family)
MPDATDMDLVREFAEHNSESAFGELVRRHINLAYSVALRFTSNSPDAQDVTQAVFIILAKKAVSLRGRTVLTGWIYETTRLTALKFLRTRVRRHQHEQEAHMQTTVENQTADDVWPEIGPLLEQAMSRLNEKERTLLALRYFENRSSEESAALLGIGDWAARKRSTRALEKLRKYFSKHGVNSTTAIIAASISANSLQLAPMALAKSVTAAAMTKGAAASASTLTLIKGALKIMAWTKAKTAIVATVAIILTAGTATVTVKSILSPSVDESLWSINSDNLAKAPAVMNIRPTRFYNRWGSVGEGDKIIGVNMPLSALFVRAYDAKSDRMILPPDRAREHFDVMLTRPSITKEMLQAQIKKQLGLVARSEVRDTNVVLLKARDPGQLGLEVSNGGQPCSYITSSYIPSNSMVLTRLVMTNSSMSSLAAALENFFSEPILDQTEMTSQYDINFQFKSSNDRPRQKAAILAELNRLGLQLVPGRAPIEMLVIDKVQ